MRALVVVAAAALASAAFPAAAETASFVEASSELDDGKPATNAYNAADGKDTTSWCAKANDHEPFLSFGFDEPVTVTHLQLIGGIPVKGADAEKVLDPAKKRARVVVIGDLQHRVEATFKDDAEPQTLEISPPVKGVRIMVQFTGFFDGKKDAPLCVSEVVLRNKSNDLTGAAVATQLRALNTPEKRLLHRWLDDVSAPTRTLTFSLDGTFRYQFDPILEGKPAKLRGKWSATNSAVTLTIGDKSWRLPMRLSKVESEGGERMEMTLSGTNTPDPSLPSTFRPAPAKLP